MFLELNKAAYIKKKNVPEARKEGNQPGADQDTALPATQVNGGQRHAVPGTLVPHCPGLGSYMLHV